MSGSMTDRLEDLGNTRWFRAPRPGGAPFRRAVALFAALLAAGLSLALAAGPAAQAKEIHSHAGSLDGSATPGGSFAGPGRMEIHQGDGILYVLDPGNDRLLKYDISDPSGPVLEDFSALGSPAITDGGPVPIQIGTEADIAVDDSGGANDGTIYISTAPVCAGFGCPSDDGDGRLLAYSANGSLLFELQEAGSSVPALGVDVVAGGAHAGDLYVRVDESCGFFCSTSEVQRWADDPAGTAAPTFATSFNAQTSFGAAGPVVAVGDNGGSIYAGGGIRRYAPDGTQLDQLHTTSPPSIAIETGDGSIYVPEFDSQAGGVVIGVYSGASATPPGELTVTFGGGQLGSATSGMGVAVHDASGTVYVTDTTNGELDIFGLLIVPDVTLGATTTPAVGEATFNGTVNPLGQTLTSCSFDYGTTTSYGQSANCVPASPTGTNPVNVSAQVSGLTPGTTYQIRLRIETADGTNEATGTYVAPGPEATTRPAGPASRRGGTALLGGTVDPNGDPSRWWIEYGTGPALTSPTSSPASEDLDAGSGPGPVDVNQLVDGLDPDTTYYFRVVAADNAAPGAHRGEILSFTTLPAPEAEPTVCPNAEYRGGGTWSASLPGCRAYERVSPADTGDGPVVPAWDIASSDGNKVTYGSTSAYAGQKSLGVVGMYVATRNADGWEAEAIDLPSLLGGRQPFETTDDLRYFYASFSHLNLPGASPPAQSHIARRGPDGTWEVISPSSDTVTVATNDGRVAYTGPGTVQVTSGPAPPPGSLGNVFQASPEDGEIQLISIDENGDPMTQRMILAGSAAFSRRASNVVSEDGSHVFFRDLIGNAEIYVRIDGATTKHVSASEIQPPAPSTRKQWGGATPDGRYVFFSTSQPLTADATANGAARSDLYRYDTETGDLIDLTTTDPAGANVTSMLGYSDDGSRAYFFATGNLTLAADGADTKIYMWDAVDGLVLLADGVTSLAGNPPTLDSYDLQGRVTPDGRYLLYGNTARASAFDNNGFRQYYRFDAETGQTDCVSCAPDGTPATGDAYLQVPSESFRTVGATSSGIFGPQPRLMADGDVVFGTPDALVERDRNDAFDVYLWDGDPRLISSGRSSTGAWPMAMTPDGESIFFATHARLVTADTNAVMDLYVARTGGGLAQQQQAPTQPKPCPGPACLEEAPPPPAAVVPSTQRRTSGGPGKAECAREHGTLRRTARVLRTRLARFKQSRRVARGSVRRAKQGQLSHKRSARAIRVLRRNRKQAKRVVRRHKRQKAALIRCRGGAS